MGSSLTRCEGAATLLRRYGTPARAIAEHSATYLSEGGQDAAVIDASGRLIAAGADVVVVAGAAVAGVAHRLRAHVSVPLPDGIACAVGQAETLVRLELRQRVAVPPLSQLLLR